MGMRELASETVKVFVFQYGELHDGGVYPSARYDSIRLERSGSISSVIDHGPRRFSLLGTMQGKMDYHSCYRKPRMRLDIYIANRISRTTRTTGVSVLRINSISSNSKPRSCISAAEITTPMTVRNATTQRVIARLLLSLVIILTSAESLDQRLPRARRGIRITCIDDTNKSHRVRVTAAVVTGNRQMQERRQSRCFPQSGLRQRRQLIRHPWHRLKL
jgi:hypothetical protein